MQVNMLKAKTELSKLVEAVESGAETEIVIARNGKPAAMLVPIPKAIRPIRFGLGKGEFVIPDPDPALDEEIARLMIEGPLFPDESR